MSRRKLTGSQVAKLFMCDEIPNGSDDGSDDELSEDGDDIDPDWVLPDNVCDDNSVSEDSGDAPDDDVEVDKENDSVSINTQPGVSQQSPPSGTSGSKQKDEKKQSKVTRPQWHAQRDNSYGQSVPQMQGNSEVHVTGQYPVEFFLALFPTDLMADIVFESKKYAVKQGKENFKLSVDDLKIFMGINMMMTYIRYPRIRMYWSSEDSLRMNFVAENMTVNRFEEIARFLHFVDAETTGDKFAKVRPVLNKLSETFVAAADFEEHLSVDEMMIPFKGRSSVKQYIKSKPKPWGFKVWVLAGVSGYVYKFEMYAGARSDKPSILGACGDVVWRLCELLRGKNHKVYFDNLFCSYHLLKQLQESSIYAVGTCRTNRLLGAESSLKTAKQLQKEGRGAMSVTTSNDNVTVVRWMDNNVVHVASTFAGTDPVDTAVRWSGKEKKLVEVSRPYAVKAYNMHMGGVDLMDQLVASYRHSLKHKRWYMRIFWHFVNVCIANAWILYRKAGLPQQDLLQFKSSVARALIQSARHSTVTKRLGRPPSSTPPPVTKKSRTVHRVADELRYDEAPGHWPAKSDKPNASRCHSPLCTSKTRYMCEKCEVPLCPECMKDFHVRQ